MFTRFYCKAFYEAPTPSALRCYSSFTCFYLCVSRTCGIVHCYGGASGVYQIGNDRWKSYPVDKIYINPSGSAARDVKYA